MACLRVRVWPWWVLTALVCSFLLTLLFPAPASAHAVLLRSEPAQNAVVRIAPAAVHLWFSEEVDPALSTVMVVNGANQRVDQQDSHVSPADTREMVVTLVRNLPPAVYIVVWRSASDSDGHPLSGSLHFTLARPDGTVPTLQGSGNAAFLDQSNTSLSGLTLLNFSMVTLAELGAVFWVGALVWLLFVLRLVPTASEEERTTNQQVQERFERRFALPTLFVVFLAHGGLLLGQALSLTNGNVIRALAPSLLVSLLTSGRFGLFLLARLCILALTMQLLLLHIQWRQQLARVPRLLAWANLLLGAALLLAMAFSSHSAAVRSPLTGVAVLGDFLHLVAAALWIGGMLFFALCYLPVLMRCPLAERASLLVTVLPAYSPWALAGVVLMAVTGPFSATVLLPSWEQVFTTLYGQVLLVKIGLVGVLLCISAIHVFLLRPRLQRAYARYSHVLAHIQEVEEGTESVRKAELLVQVKRCEDRLAQQTCGMMRILRLEPLLGVMVLVCVGLLNVFGGTLVPAGATQQSLSATGPFHTTVQTFDKQLTITLAITPNRLGTNTFLLSVVQSRTAVPITQADVSLETKMGDMDMDTFSLRAAGTGGTFRATADLEMEGDWQIIIRIVTPQNKFYEAYVERLAPS